jgi:hypothetical protein
MGKKDAFESTKWQIFSSMTRFRDLDGLRGSRNLKTPLLK